MVHADAVAFATGSKEEVYEQLLLQAAVLFEGQRNWVNIEKLSFCCQDNNMFGKLTPTTSQVCNLANTASLLWHAYKSLPAPSSSVNWAGFYVLDVRETTKKQLILGPFHGKVACQTISFGRGVCGTAAHEKRTQLVPDVDKFPGHIACDGDSRSEIVAPILVEGTVVAIIDIDCAEVDGFDRVDKMYLERLADMLGKSCDW